MKPYHAVYEAAIVIIFAEFTVYHCDTAVQQTVFP